jgi:hypothetical protein
VRLTTLVVFLLPFLTVTRILHVPRAVVLTVEPMTRHMREELPSTTSETLEFFSTLIFVWFEIEALSID